jgi:hypothetical protein
MVLECEVIPGTQMAASGYGIDEAEVQLLVQHQSQLASHITGIS